MKKGPSRAPAELSPELLAELQAAAELPDAQINIQDPDAPEVTDWAGALRGRFYKPRKVQKTLRRNLRRKQRTPQKAGQAG